ncbi:MAG: hypothetical protein AB7K24_13255 [Gemmataceae bacterium]
MAGTDTMMRGSSTAPILIDLGKKSRKKIKRLRRGEGDLMDDVNHAIQELRNANKIGASAQPVVVIVREKPQSLMGW